MTEVKKLKAVKSTPNGLPKILEESTVEINSYEVVSLWQILNALTNGNNLVPPSVARFIAKNTKKLTASNKKSIGAEDALKLEYWEKDNAGRNIYWDGVTDHKKPLAEGEEDTGEMILGVKAYLDAKKNVFFNSASGEELPIEKAMQMKMYIPLEKTMEYSTKLKALQEEKNTVYVTKINLDYLEDVRIAIPTSMTVATGNPQNPKEQKKIPLDLDAFFEYLIIGGDEKPAQENNN